MRRRAAIGVALRGRAAVGVEIRGLQLGVALMMRRATIGVVLPGRAMLGASIRVCMYELKDLLTDGGEAPNAQTNY